MQNTVLLDMGCIIADCPNAEKYRLSHLQSQNRLTGHVIDENLK